MIWLFTIFCVVLPMLAKLAKIALRIPVILLVFDYTKKVLNSDNKHEQQFYIELIVKLIEALNTNK